VTNLPSDHLKLARCCEAHVTQPGVLSPTVCRECGSTLMVRDREWQVAPDDKEQARNEEMWREFPDAPAPEPKPLASRDSQLGQEANDA
jgi:hypothetical protein